MTPQHEPILLDRSSRFSLRSGALPSSRRLPTPRASRHGAVDGAWWPHTTEDRRSSFAGSPSPAGGLI